MNRGLLFLLWLICTPLLAAESHPPIHHQLDVKLEPQRQTLSVTDRISFTQPPSEFKLILHADLNPRFSTDRGKVQVRLDHQDRFAERYEISLPKGADQLTVEYTGRIHHRLSSSRREQSRGFRSSAGLIDKKGVFLAAGSLWYPQIEGYPYLTFNMQVSLPAGWSSVTQGHRQYQNNSGKLNMDRWHIDKPQDEIYLIAAEFIEYQKSAKLQGKPVSAQVFLRSADQKLADRYLQATVKYLKMYEQLIGAYPYSKFALVENFWETGFGMPSFTLLGSRVIRLPFILNTSYPHEILHNWWGNGVYVDFDRGNWSEGLTAYLADHLIKEQQNQGANYRLQSLQKYRDYAAKQRDFPLTAFKSRHSSATEAVGYGKTLMMFHMLRKQLGDQLFTKALRQFYQQYEFKIASFADLRQTFEEVSGESLSGFFTQWVEYTGAPELRLVSSNIDRQADRVRLQFTLQQLQADHLYELNIPVAVSLTGQTEAKQSVVTMLKREQTFEMDLPSSPTRLDIDPQFDLFRKLALEETPPAFTQIFGAEKLLVIYPSDATHKMKKAWRAFADDISHMGPEKVTIIADDEIETLPENSAAVVLGWNNRFTKQVEQQLKQHPLTISADVIRVGEEQINRKNSAFAWITRIRNQAKQPYPLALITADLPNALPGLGRKIPHYHKYSYLAFSGTEPKNSLKGRWPVANSPMSRLFTPGAERAELAASSPLIEPVLEYDPQKMKQTVSYLSDRQLQGRGVGSKGLDLAADYIAAAFKKAGLTPGGEKQSYFQYFDANDEQGQSHRLKNVIGVIPGRHPQLSKQNLVIGGHYDHLGLGWPDVRDNNRGKIHFGADDNASGIAVMLELARILSKNLKPDRNVVFVAFSGEETGRLGSKHYVKHQQSYPVSDTIGMLNLDTVGRLFDNKLIVLGAESASEWPHIFRGIGFVTGIESAMVNEPLDASDQISFHEAGVPAVQLFSGPHTDYHRPGDTVDKIDIDGMIKVAEVSKQVVEYLAGREEPMTIQLAGIQQPDKSSKQRKVSLGTIPDFTYQGNGYRLDGVVPNSPADKAGLKKKDIIVSIDQTPIKGLRDLSKTLKSLKQGQTIQIEYLRNGTKSLTSAQLKSR
ncbi:MAG: M20/M25/M40 family metallo-hydrolase [Candidatus Thiodiazotropha taylori]|nr:M20/M25/M40 family metallo-hydrolase [Candidatus Thiodiazotropha taylori]MCG8110937.1 M20/M25/M40 family metallo-hydrolase [Candidatus Thiodiazotropha taylori]MCW4283287.1 M20/M25/M40 family metallo-hydrolase [Candidatus Thiodiazotropha taylori]MCW4306255.1 M20/M25/M40 family metallo-hydrolase [Candidatus Thiodiazotropha taylori]